LGRRRVCRHRNQRSIEGKVEAVKTLKRLIGKGEIPKILMSGRAEEKPFGNLVATGENKVKRGRRRKERKGFRSTFDVKKVVRKKKKSVLGRKREEWEKDNGRLRRAEVMENQSIGSDHWRAKVLWGGRTGKEERDISVPQD